MPGGSLRPPLVGLIAGGGMRTGQVIAATDKHAAYPVERRTHFGEVSQPCIIKWVSTRIPQPYLI